MYKEVNKNLGPCLTHFGVRRSNVHNMRDEYVFNLDVCHIENKFSNDIYNGNQFSKFRDLMGRIGNWC